MFQWMILTNVQKSNADLNTAAKKGGLLPSFAHGMTLELGVKGAIQDVVTEHFNSNMSSQDAVKKLSAAVSCKLIDTRIKISANKLARNLFLKILCFG